MRKKGNSSDSFETAHDGFHDISTRATDTGSQPENPVSVNITGGYRLKACVVEIGS